MALRDAHHTRLDVLHDSVVGGKISAREEIARILLERVRFVLSRQMPHVDPAIVNNACEDAILKYLANPQVYQRSRARLDTFVRFVARRKVLDAVAKEARRKRIEQNAADENEKHRPL
jgi:DNA-directed RNA polymerase specialized sigma24 family protein